MGGYPGALHPCYLESRRQVAAVNTERQVTGVKRNQSFLLPRV